MTDYVNKRTVYEVSVDDSIGGPGITGGSFYSKEEAESYAKELTDALSMFSGYVTISVRIRDGECHDIAEGAAPMNKVIRFCMWVHKSRRCRF